MFGNGDWLILALFAYLVVVTVYVVGILTGRINLPKPIFKKKERKKALEEELKRLKEKYGAGFQFYPYGGSGWHVQLNAAIMPATSLQEAGVELTKLDFDFYKGDDVVESWFPK